MDYSELIHQLRVKQNRPIPYELLSVDPGETTGYAIFKNGQLFKTGQIAVKEQGLVSIYKEFQTMYFDHIVIEDYRIYPSKLKDHSLNEVFTVKVIGAIELMFQIRQDPPKFIFQMATVPKSFVTNEKMAAWDMWAKSKPHAREAVRHGIYYLLFGH